MLLAKVQGMSQALGYIQGKILARLLLLYGQQGVCTQVCLMWQGLRIHTRKVLAWLLLLHGQQGVCTQGPGTDKAPSCYCMVSKVSVPRYVLCGKALGYIQGRFWHGSCYYMVSKVSVPRVQGLARLLAATAWSARCLYPGPRVCLMW